MKIVKRLSMPWYNSPIFPVFAGNIIISVQEVRHCLQIFSIRMNERSRKLNKRRHKSEFHSGFCKLWDLGAEPLCSTFGSNSQLCISAGLAALFVWYWYLQGGEWRCRIVEKMWLFNTWIHLYKFARPPTLYRSNWHWLEFQESVWDFAVGKQHHHPLVGGQGLISGG